MKQDADTNLKLARKQLQEQKRFEKLLAETRERMNEVQKSLELARSIVQKEQEDVDELEEVSLKSVFYSLTGDKEQLLDKEKQDAAKARLKYNAALDRKAELERLQIHYREMLKRYQYAQKHYDDALAAKRKELHSDLQEQLLVMDERIADLQQEQKELSEAIEAASPVDEYLKQLEQVLVKASGWGKFDVWGGGVFASAAKHEQLEKARTLAGNVEKYMEVFNVELADLNKGFRMDSGVNIEKQHKFWDIFFDNLFSDLTVQKQISHSLESVRETHRELINMEKALRQEYAAVENELKEAQQEKAQLIERG